MILEDLPRTLLSFTSLTFVLNPKSLIACEMAGAEILSGWNLTSASIASKLTVIFTTPSIFEISPENNVYFMLLSSKVLFHKMAKAIKLVTLSKINITHK